MKSQKMPNPTKLAQRHGFILDTFDLTQRRFLGTCVCGTRGTLSCGMLSGGKFCRNPDCEFFQSKKKLDHTEMKIIAEEMGCTVISLAGSGVKATIEFICSCGFKQKNTWRSFYGENWCHYFLCPHYKKLKTMTTDLMKDWFAMEGYICDEEYGGNFHNSKHDVMCPKGHVFPVSMDMWIKNSRCKICNGDGRTLSYQKIREFYEQHGCSLLYREEDFKGNITVNEVPYVCEKGHVISNLTKNNFNTRINQGLQPCAVCQKLSRNETKEEETKVEETDENVPETEDEILSDQEYRQLYEKYQCSIISETDKIVTYTCLQDHLIDSLTRQEFKQRIDSKKGPCPLCTELYKDNSRFQRIRNHAKNVGAEVYFLKNRKVAYICKCGRSCNSWDNNILKEKFQGCTTCANPFNNPEIQAKIRQTNLKIYGHENPFQVEKFKEKIKATVRERYGVENVMQNEAIFKLNMKNSRLKKKPYEFPSGRIDYVQGYEPRCIDILLENYQENDIVTDPEKIPPIWYYNPIKKNRARYFPDIFLPEENVCIEVKSDYTLAKEGKITRKKIDATVKAGYTVWLYVFDKKEFLYREIYTENDWKIEYKNPAVLIYLDD